MKKNPNIQKISNRTAILALVLTAIMVASMTMMLPTVFAVQQPVIGHIYVNPPLIGLGQTVNIQAWVSPPPIYLQNGTMILYKNYTFTITKPDNNVENIVGITSYGEGSAYYIYKPDQLGTYKVVFAWAGDDQHQGTSVNSNFTVQQQKIPSYQDTSLPTDYWTRPIDGQNRLWYSISGAWTQSSFSGGPGAACDNFNPYSTSPGTSHVLWKNPVSFGGLVGGQYGSLGVSATPGSPVIMWGKYFYTANNLINCLDLKTGQTLWTVTGSGSLFAVPNPGPYLFAVGTSINRYNPYSGELQQSIARVAPYTSGQSFADIGLGYAYAYFRVNDTLPNGLITKYNLLGTSTNFTQNIVWNDVLTDSNQTGSFITIINNMILPMGNIWVGKNLMAINATNGALIWSTPITDNHLTMHCVGNGNAYAICYDGRVRAYSLADGHKVWESQPQDYPWNEFCAYSMAFAYDMVYDLCYDGHIYAYNSTNGALVWKFGGGVNPSDARSSTGTGETPYGVYPFYSGFSVADGKVFAANSEHSTTQPIWRGAKFYCVDAWTGRKVWSLNNFYSDSQKPVAEGVVTASNSYTSLLYGFGKGQSITTVSASPSVVSSGSGVLITGTVMDQSPAQPDTPCIADDGMDAWMNYLHQWEQKPTNVTGVPVKLTAIGEDGTKVDVGTPWSDTYGNYACLWTPPARGVYKIIVSYEGSNSYYASSAETSLGVTAAPAASAAPTASTAPSSSPTATQTPAAQTTGTPTPTETQSGSPSVAPTPPGTTAGTDMYIIIAVAVVVIVVIVVAALFLRRRK